MKLLVTGATGFTGSHVVPLLLAKGHDVHCLARGTSDRTVLPDRGIGWVEGDLGDFDAMRRGLQGTDALVNIASIGFGHAGNIVRAALAQGVKRAIFISTTAIFTTLNAGSKSVRLAAEEQIRRSGLAFTILRPTMIYGSGRDRNMCRLIRYLQKAPVIPVAGNGKNLQQPVYVGDVASAVADCLENPRTEGRCYNIPGADPLTFDEVLNIVSSLLGKEVLKVHLPARPLVRFLRLAEGLGLLLPLKAEQIQRLNEDKAFDYGEAARDFGYGPLRFREGITLELHEMGLLRGETR